MSEWQLDYRRGSADAHHQRPVPDQPARAVWIHVVERPALVLGSAQRFDLVDRELAAVLGIELVKRRSGGGAVLLVPGDVAWLDVILPAEDPLWEDDVSRAGLWLGRVWKDALADLGVVRTTVHEGPLACGNLGRMVCFGAVGPGEVTREGRKVVGVSQRRKRSAARFQCAVYRRWQPDLLCQLLRLNHQSAAQLSDAAVGVGAAPDTIAEAFVRHLPS